MFSVRRRCGWVVGCLAAMRQIALSRKGDVELEVVHVVWSTRGMIGLTFEKYRAVRGSRVDAGSRVHACIADVYRWLSTAATVWLSRAPASDGAVERAFASVFVDGRFALAASILSGEPIQSPIRSRKGLPIGSSSRSRMTDSGFKSPTNRSVLDKAGKDGPADADALAVAVALCARVASFENDRGRS